MSKKPHSVLPPGQCWVAWCQDCGQPMRTREDPKLLRGLHCIYCQYPKGGRIRAAHYLLDPNTAVKNASAGKEET